MDNTSLLRNDKVKCSDKTHRIWVDILQRARWVFLSAIESKTGSDKELIDLNKYVLGYFELIRLWLTHIGDSYALSAQNSGR